MATLEKPKQKKKKKVKPLVLEEVAWSNADIEYPSTSTSDDIEIIQQNDVFPPIAELSELAIDDGTVPTVPVASAEDVARTIECDASEVREDSDESKEAQEAVENVSNVSTVQLAVENIAKELDSVADPIQPSAPHIDDLPAITESPWSKPVQYPDLHEMTRLEPSTVSGLQQMVQQRIILKPFNETQLNELYHNPQLKLAERFEGDFISNELSCVYKEHPLYELIKKYSQSRYNLKINMLDLQNYIKTVKVNLEDVWKISMQTFYYEGVCQDNERVQKSERYEFASLDNDKFQKVSASLNNMMQLVCYNYMTNMYACESYKMQIEQSIREMLQMFKSLNLSTDSPAVLVSATGDGRYRAEAMHNMRVTISILFYFLRRFVPDSVFSADVKAWLAKVAAIYVRLATWMDHTFLIYHVLRCPPGIASWATSIIQVPAPSDSHLKETPASPFANAEINHCVTFLKVLLMPTKQRNDFLAQLNQANTPIDATTDDLWIVIDSDGEEDQTPAGECAALKENDLIAIFNQVPFEQMFASMTFAYWDGDQRRVNVKRITGHHLLKFIAFATNLVELIGEGLKTYATERFKQFAKLLSRLVRQTVQYVSDMHTIFKNGDSLKDDQICARIQIEFDTFVLRSSQYIYRLRCLGAWQYLAILPFSELHISTVWKLYHLLTVGFTKDAIENVTEDYKTTVSTTDWLDKFNDTIIDVPAEDMYYLLQTFASMAMARPWSDGDFVYCVTADLFKIGFLNAITKDSCYKIARDLLVNLTTNQTDLISCLLLMLKQNFRAVDKYGTYLFKSLPLDQWHPPMDVFEIAANWLLNFGFETSESAMARTIFSRLNWNFDKRTNELFLPHKIHIRMACLIVEVSSKHVPETIGLSGISESVRQVSSLMKGQSPQQQFSTWCWNMVAVLRLHCFDQSSEFIRRAIRSPQDALRHVSEIERLLAIAAGVVDNRPLAVYLSILSTLWGHSVPQICHKGFSQMHQLLQDCRHSAVLRCLQLVTPFFLECPDSLSKCTAFQTILAAILSADRTYIRMAKDFISNDYPGPVVEMFANMVQAQIIDYASYGLPTPALLIHLWLTSFTATPNWYKDTNTIRIVNLILRVAFQFADAWQMSRELFKRLCISTNETKPSPSSSILPFLGGSQPTGLLASPLPSAPWLALLMFEVEHETYELDTKLWPELIRQLRTTSAKFSMDSVIKASAKAVGTPPCAAHSLVIYKLFNLILNCPHDEPALPLFCQLFFHLYLTRVRYPSDEIRFNDMHGVADKFYEHNTPLMKQLKRYLIEAAKRDHDRSVDAAGETESQWFSARSRLYHSFQLWLEETRLNQMAQIRHDDFPMQYDLHRLSYIFADNYTHWTDFVDLAGIRKTQRDEANTWLRSCFRYIPGEKHSVISSRGTKSTDPKDSIVRLLGTYDAPQPPPPVHIERRLLKDIDLNKNVLTAMENDFKKIVDLSLRFNMDVQELSSLDSNYKEMLPQLHENKYRSERKEFRCSHMLSNHSCRGATYMAVQIPYHTINEIISNKLQTNRDRHETLINKLAMAPTESQILPIVQIQYSIRRLLDVYRHTKQRNDQRHTKEIANIANKFFYHLINGINENVNAFHPAQDLCTVVLSQLGVFLQDNQNTEGMNLLKTALKRPDLLKPISDLFVPAVTVPEVFLELYKFIVDSHLKNCDPNVLFVLLSKFDVSGWLTHQKPKLSDINALVHLIVQGLECWIKSESALIQGVLRCHLIHIFMHDFPEHYGEVLLIVLRGCSEKKLMPSILLELLNTIYKMSKCPDIDILADASKTREHVRSFATNQRLFTYHELHETISLLARHFQHERLQHGLHGLYAIHKDYCSIVAVVLESYGYALIVSAVHTNPGALSDTLVDWLWPSICEMFSPWLFPYYTQNLPNLPANWIRQFNTPILVPWSEFYEQYAQQLLHSFVGCIQLLLDTFPACDLILGYIFYWYETNYGNVTVPRHIIVPMNNVLMQLPWNRMKPTPTNIAGFYRLLQQYLPECHSFLGFIFLRVPWTPWLQCNIHQWDAGTRPRILSALLLMFVKLSCEPNVRESLHLLTILQEAASYPWQLLDCAGVEGTFEWYTTSTEPSAILCLNSEHSAVDNAILNLLQVASCIRLVDTEHRQSATLLQSKRLSYVRSIVRMLRLCGSKYQQLMATADGQISFNAAVHNLMTLVNNNVTTENEVDGISAMAEIIGSTQTHGESTSKLFVDAIVVWQSKTEIGNAVINATLNAIGSCKTFSLNLLILLEATVFNYFRYLESTKKYHSPTWRSVCDRMGPRLPSIDPKQLIENDHLLCLHIFAIYKLREHSDSGAKISFLQSTFKQLENYNTKYDTEPKIALLWGLLIVCGSKLIDCNENVKVPLLQMARYLQTTSNSTDGWGDGLLGAIGLKRETISNKRRILTRCLACIVFSLFPESEAQHKEYAMALDELKATTKSKKYADVKANAMVAIDIVEGQCRSTSNTKQNVCAIIRLFYNNCFLTSLEDIWIL